MKPGTFIDNRFEIERLAGSGGMGQVFRARDTSSGELVAIKVLLKEGAPEAARFGREARVLSELQHPGIVRYIAHGVAPSGELYLAMEWLDGEDLQRRLRRTGLTVQESLRVAVCVAEALGAAHARGIVHRDLKPSNVFLPGGNCDSVKLLDFGIAHLGAATRMTQTGMLVGTPGYMAPEQARGAQDIDARADVFSLGCMLFECLTGEPAFRGAHLMAILAKIMFDQPPSVRDRLPGLPEALDALVGRMVAKNPEDRPADGRDVAEALRALGEMPELSAGAPVGDALQHKALTGSEQRALAVILIGAPGNGEVKGLAGTVTEIDDAGAQLRREAQLCGGQFERLMDGSAAVVMTDTTLATDLAAQAARCALSLHRCAPGRAIALAMGRGEVTGRLPIGRAIDRAARIFEGKTPKALPASDGPVVLDDMAAGLLDARFDVREGETGFVLHGERELGEGSRTLLGKATPCVGRERELRTLEELFNECVEDAMPHAVVVTAPPGAGKSRLGQEFLRQVKQRGEPVAIWIGRGDSLRAGSAFGLLGQAIRGACGIQDGEPLETRRAKLLGRVAERVAEAERRRVAEFLGEIIGTLFPSDESLPLRAARQDAQLMNDQMRSAFLDFLAAESGANPVLIVLEDLHWGDRPTVQFLDRAQLELRGKAVFVLAMARPEVHELFPKLWAGRRAQEVRLHRLNPKAIERLSRHVLGPSAGPKTIERLVRLSEGNAFYLEELIRATAQGHGAELPETVVAMVQSRLGALDDASRRLLRAASVFGEVFWAGSVAALLGGAERMAALRKGLSELVEQELIVKRNESRFSDEQEYAFRHALLREGAYAMLTEEDRTLGHKLAGEWLEQHGEQEALLLAEHFERGGEEARAGLHYLRVAEQAASGRDSAAAIGYMKRALAHRIPDELRVRCLGMLCELHYYNFEVLRDALPHAEELVRFADRGSAPWSQGMLVKLAGSIQAGDVDTFRAMLNLMAETRPEPDAARPWALGVVSGIYMMDLFGWPRDADRLIEHFVVVLRAGDRGLAASAMLSGLLALRMPYARENPWKAMEHVKIFSERSLTIRYHRFLGYAKLMDAMNRWFLGEFESAERIFTGSAVPDEEAGLLSSLRPVCLAWMLAERGEMAEARTWANRLVASGQSRRVPLDEGRGHWVLAEVLRRAGELEEAEREIQTALAILGMACPLDHPGALATLAALRLAQARPAEALAAAEEALAKYESMGACGFFRGAFLRLTHAECLEATGNHEAARAAIAKARQCIFANADKITDAAYRKSFLENVPENRRTLELAQQWLGESSARS